MKVAGRGCIFQTTLGPIQAHNLPFLSLDRREEGIHTTEVGILHYVKLNHLVQLNYTQIIALICRKCFSMYFNGRHNIY